MKLCMKRNKIAQLCVWMQTLNKILAYNCNCV